MISENPHPEEHPVDMTIFSVLVVKESFDGNFQDGERSAKVEEEIRVTKVVYTTFPGTLVWECVSVIQTSLV